ncbi:hypothetical protein [Geomicrobium sp. JCM 19039]|uniref:phage tail assembly chaperone n=1 Tax=Geomicrobium sp. JCM 19039 TaxID=1460636 RepID=UPI00045F4139|nr:hypothetical protein [Geomicrobium sp. JCM 19039]GAK11400.1 phage-like element PBSX protein XkdN [Geomicrobium sp. JCM 19039]
MTNKNENMEVEANEVETKGRDVSFFLSGAAEEVTSEFVPISKRFKDGEGKIVKFEMKAIETEKVDEIQKQCMINDYVNRKLVGKKLDQQRFSARIAVESTLYPNFKDAQLRKSYKTEDPIEVAKKMLSVPGEYTELISNAMRINGFDDYDEDLVDDVKN